MKHILLAATCLGMICGVGCGDRGPAVAPVSGLVTLDGTPVEGAMVFFEPVAGGRSSTAMTDATGAFSLKYSAEQKGALVGDHVVRVTKSRGAIYADNGQVVEKEIPELFPKSANVDSTLTAKVEKKTNRIDFPITSK